MSTNTITAEDRLAKLGFHHSPDDASEILARMRLADSRQT